MNEHFNAREVAANRSSRMVAETIGQSGMETETIENGAVPKSQRVGRNFLILSMAFKSSRMVAETIGKSSIEKIVFFIGLLILSAVNVHSYGQELVKDKENGLWGYVDKSSGRVVIFYQYAEAKEFSEGLAAVRFEGKWGFIDKKGVVVIPHKYKSVKNFSNGYAMVQEDGFWGAIDKNGTQIISCIYIDIYSANAAVLERKKALERERIAALKREETPQKQEVANPTATNTPDIIILKNGQEIKAYVTIFKNGHLGRGVISAGLIFKF